MPFKSEAQRRFMHAKHPEIANRWEKKYDTPMSMKTLLSGEYGEAQERKRLKPPNQVTGPRG